jgi:hypothetical protein
MHVEAKLEELGLTLPEAPKLPPGVRLSFAWVRVHQDRAYVAGQGPLNPDGSVAEPLGKVGVDLTPEQGYEAARSSALTILSSLKRELGDLDRVTAWLMVYGLVNAGHARAHGTRPGDAAARGAGHHRGGGSYKRLALRLSGPLFHANF